MSMIIAALTLAATPAAQPASAASANHANHVQHMQAMQKHHDECKDMMAKMHKGMKHDGHAAPQGDRAGEHRNHGSH
jgi:hypothetical protein